MKETYIDGYMLKKMIKRGAKILNINKELVDSLNVFPVPDGDTGTNMSLTLDSAVKEMDLSKDNSVAEIAARAAKGSLMGARGNSGVILSQILRGIAKSVENKEKIDSHDFALALQKGSDTAYKAVMKPVEGTILTVVRECAKTALNFANKNLSLEEISEKTFYHCEKVLARTQYMLPTLKEAGVVDAGGKGFVYIMQGIYEVLKGVEDDEQIEELIEEKTAELTVFKEDIVFVYCTEAILKGDNIEIEIMREDLSIFGDSLLVVGDSELVKLHIHTNNPGAILEYCLKLGELKEIKIENMKEQHIEYIKDSIQDEINSKKDIEEETDKIGIISVVSGKGLEDIYTSLGCDKIIRGGQTMNPSTEDILNSIEKLNFQEIIVLPNNSNIILTALQAKKVSKKNVHVIPTKNIPQGINALMALNIENDIENNVKKMEEAIKDVKTIEITFAVRDSVFNGMEIKTGNFIGLVDGEIKQIGDNINDVLLAILKDFDCDDFEVITVFYGEDIDKSEAKGLSEQIQALCHEWEVEFHYGGQPLYYYIISME